MSTLTAVSSYIIPSPLPKGTGPIESWDEYENSLDRRGDPDKLFRWLLRKLDAMEKRRPTPRTKQTGMDRGGRSRVYTDAEIWAVLVVQAWLRGKGLRQTLSFCRRWSKGKGLKMKWPDHSTVSRRARLLSVKLLLRASGPRALHADVAVDSTGLTARGPGLHRLSRKLEGGVTRLPVRSSVLVNLLTQEVLASATSPPSEGDPSAVPRLLAEVRKGTIGALAADGAYDTATVYGAALEHGIEEVRIPPTVRSNTFMKNNHWHPNTPGSGIRNEAVRDIIRENEERLRPPADPAGRKAWKERSGYYRRSLVETAMSGLSRLCGSRLSGRSYEARAVRFQALCSALNFDVFCGMPERQRSWRDT